MFCCGVLVCFVVVFWCGALLWYFGLVFCLRVLLWYFVAVFWCVGLVWCFVCCFGTVICCGGLVSRLVGGSLEQTSEKCHRQVWVHDQGKHCLPSRKGGGGGGGRERNNNNNVGSRK